MRYALILTTLLALSGCGTVNRECPEVEDNVLQVGIGFYKQSDRYNPIDLSFESVSAIGYNAELVGRQYNNVYHLPVPLNSSSVSYVFKREATSDTLTIHYAVGALYNSAICPATLYISSVEVNLQLTSFQFPVGYQTNFYTNETVISLFID